jgi:hypothetical protein
MSHGITATFCNSLKQEGNSCDILRHEFDGQKFKKCLISLAIPAELRTLRHFKGLYLQTALTAPTDI